MPASWQHTAPSDDFVYANFFNNTPACVRFLYAFNILRRPSCPSHNCPCVSVEITTANQRVRYVKKGSDVFWKCQQCSWSKAITYGSALHGLKKLTLFKCIKLIYKFYQGRTAQEASEDDGLDYQMCREWYDWFRRCISHYMQNYYYPQFEFDDTQPIEWDESSFAGKQKHHRGRIVRDPVWVLGGGSKNVKHCFSQNG